MYLQRPLEDFNLYINQISTHFPKNRVDNSDIVSNSLVWNSDKAFDKLGIRSRYVAEDSSVSEMAIEAGNRLFALHPKLRTQVDGLIVCTQSPDYLLPTTACIVQKGLGVSNHTAAFDINLGCSGYIYSLAVAKGLLAAGILKNILIITSDRYSNHIRADDIGNRLIFGDAAAATLVSTQSWGMSLKVLDFDLGSDGSGAKNLFSSKGGMRGDSDGCFFMNGPEIFNFTMREVPSLVENNLARNGLDISTTDYFIFHQANKFMLESLRKKIKIPEHKFLVEFSRYGNTVSATIPIVLESAGGHLKNEETLQLVGFGVGYSWGAVVLKKME